MSDAIVEHLFLLFGDGAMTELAYTDSECKVVLRRPAGRVAVPAAPTLVGDENVNPNPAVTLQQVKSPAAGRFVAVHPCTSETALSAGNHIAVDDVVGYLEIDGVLSCIRSSLAGAVAQIEVRDGQLVGTQSNVLSVTAMPH